MIHFIYAVRDAKAEAFLPPFVLPRSSMAIRTFTDCIQSDDHQFGAHPEDYSLWRLGAYDDENGEISAEPTPVLEKTGIECSATPPIGAGNGASQITQGSSVQSGSPGEDTSE